MSSFILNLIDFTYFELKIIKNVIVNIIKEKKEIKRRRKIKEKEKHRWNKN